MVDVLRKLANQKDEDATPAYTWDPKKETTEMRFMMDQLGARSHLRNLINQMKTNPPLELDLTNSNIKPFGIEVFCKYLRHNTRTKYLRLSQNTCGPAGAAEIGVCMQINAALTNLDLSETELTGSPFRPDLAGVLQIAKSLRMNRSLTTIDFSRNLLLPHGVGSIASCTAYSQTLTHLNFSDTQCCSGGDEFDKGNNEGLVSMAHSLQFVNRSITAVDFRHNSLSRTAVEALSRAFVTNKTLTSLVLSDCRLQPPELAFLVRCASVDPVLFYLDLSGNERLCGRDPDLDAIPHIVDRCYPDDHKGDDDPALERTECDLVAQEAAEAAIREVRARIEEIGAEIQRCRDDATMTAEPVTILQRTFLD